MGNFFISIDELKNLIGTAAAPVIYDTCRAPVYSGHQRILPTARWRDHTDVETWLPKIPAGAHVVVNCVHGHNVSQLAVSDLRRRGVNAQTLFGGIDGWIAEDGPTILKAALPGRDEAKPSRWVTRIRPKIDRIACPWLITRFIDREAEFYFVQPDYVAGVSKELGGIPYDIDGVAFTHVGETCTFDTLIDAFGLNDPALAALKPIVRGADTARLDLAPEAAGLAAASFGVSALAGGDDHKALAHGFAIYDALYAWQKFAQAETHNWPAKTASESAHA